MSNKLKSCPMCGGEAMIKTLPLGERIYVVCKTCLTSTDFFENEADAKDHWNARHERSCRMEIASNERPGKTIFNQWYVCSECRTPMSPGDNYCHNCGAKVACDWSEGEDE